VTPKPQWYHQISTSKDEIFGYAKAQTCEQADSKAREDIAKQLVVSIDSELTISEDSKGEHYSKSTIKESVKNIKLSALQPIHAPEYLNDICYVGLSFSTQTLLFKASLVAKNEAIKEMKPDNLLRNTLFAEQLLQNIDYIPEFSLVFKANQPSLHIGTSTIALTAQNMRLFLFEQHSPDLSLSILPKTSLKQGERYSIKIESKKDNYISLIYIDEFYNARIAIENQYTHKNKSVSFPKGSDQIEAGILSGSSLIKEIYIALLCDEPLNLAPFSILDAHMQTDVNALKLSDLLSLTIKCESVAKILTVKR